MNPQAFIRTSLDGDVMVIHAPPRISAQEAANLRETLGKVLEDGNAKVVIDLADTRMVDSTGLGALVSRIASARSNGGDVRLARVKDFVVNLLEITHLNQVFECFDTVEEAVQSFA